MLWTVVGQYAEDCLCGKDSSVKPAALLRMLTSTLRTDELSK
jgi:hypothetical protein